jgi:eukaryotic-like serine/threonine-protein kinase
VLGEEPEEHVKILDFGLVRSLAEVEPGQAPGSIVGTPGFIAPECLAGEPGDERADIYALGAVMYCLLTGEDVFAASEIRQVLEQHLHKEPRRPSAVRPDLPGPVDEVVLRCLAKDPRQRFASMAELRKALVRAEAAG